MLLPTQEDPFTPLRDRWEGKGQSETGFLPTGTFVAGRWGCDKHMCAAFCHDACALCEVRQFVQRWRGKEEKQVWCGVGEPADCLVEGDVCARFFDCGIHKCEKPRHRPSPQPFECPPSHLMSLTVLVGRALSRRLPSLRDLSIHSLPLRSHPHLHLPLLESPHGALIHAKRNATLGPAHHAQSRSRARADVEGTTLSLPCHQIHNSGPSDHPEEESELLRDLPCAVLRACGSRQCPRVCCPLASLTSTSVKKGKKRVGQGKGDGHGHEIGEESGGLCQSVC